MLSSMDTFGKSGSRIDHHFKDKDGKFQSSPPKELKDLYSMPAQGGPPNKLSIQADINSLKAQTHCCGVYTLMPKHQINSKPVWKHTCEDLVICSGSFNGEDGWLVSRFTTSGSSRQQVCMRVVAPGKESLPTKGHNWQEWNGRDWAAAPTVKCRASWHGWGLEKLDRTRLKFSPSSPEGAY